jgi:hypothetical protein
MFPKDVHILMPEPMNMLSSKRDFLDLIKFIDFGMEILAGLSGLTQCSHVSS